MSWAALVQARPPSPLQHRRTTPALPAQFTLEATASQPFGSVSQVEFFTNGISAGIDPIVPYWTSVEGLAAGTHILTAVATANGLTATSSITVIATNVPIQPPTVVLTSPANEASVCDCTLTIVSATATNPGAQITLVQFFNHGTNLLAALTERPYRIFVPCFGLATNRLTAVAHDANGSSATSAVVTVYVNGLVETNHLGIVNTFTNTVALCFRGLINSNYVIEAATNLPPTGPAYWHPLFTNTAPAVTFGEYSVVDTNMAPGKKFYRARRH